MSTPWPTHKDIQLNRQLNKRLQKITHTIRYYKWWKLFHIGCQVSGGENFTAQDIASKLSGSFYEVLKVSLELCVLKRCLKR